MRKLSAKAVLIPTITLFLVCVIITAALAFTNAITSGRISQNEAASQQESMKIVCPNAEKFEEITPDVLYKGIDKNGNPAGYAVSTTSNGYGGQLKVMTGIKDGKVINIDVYYCSDETPGLGQNTANDNFTNKFRNLLTNDYIVVDKDYNGEGQKVDAVTSSTISSRAVVDAVNKACDIYNKEVAGGEQ